MLLKVSEEYLDFDDLIEMERQIKLFEDLSTTDGDYSYSFELQKTINNTRLLGNPQPDNISKLVYTKIPASIVSESGVETYKGFIRVEGITEVYRCSFFAGNNNWFGMLSGSLRELDWSEFNVVQNQSNIQNSTLKTEGIVFPLVDNGLLYKRGGASIKVEDFVPAIYVKTVFNKIFSTHGIKIQGELINDANFQAAITISNSKSEDQIEARSSFVRTTNSPNPNGGGPVQKVVWTNDSTYPYYDGAQDNFDLPNSRYIADVPMTVKSEVTINDTTVPGLVGEFEIYIYVNGVEYDRVEYFGIPPQPLTFNLILKLNAGDVMEVYVYNDAQISANPLINTTWKITPVFLYYVYVADAIPAWTQQQYVSAVLKLFNVLSSYDSDNKILTFNLFDKIKDKEAIDISEYIESTEVDYSEFVSDFYKKSYFGYKELENPEDFLQKNLDTTSYSKGFIAIDNDFLEDSGDILESDFSQPVTYLNPAFDMSIERTDLITVDEQETSNASSITNASGRARFNIDADVFLLGDLVRISDSPNVKYNGDYVVYSIGSGYVEFVGLFFDTNTYAKLQRLGYIYNDSEKVYILRNVPTYGLSKFSTVESIVFEATEVLTWSPAYFDLIDTGRQINADFIYSFSFSPSYQIGLLEQYYKVATRSLNDPVKLIQIAYLPYDVFLSLDFLVPVTIKTEETTNEYYLNRITGYKESYYSCQLELIKI